MTCSLPKNVTIFHKEEDSTIQFCLSPPIRGVIAHKSKSADLYFIDCNLKTLLHECGSSAKLNVPSS